MSILQVFSIRDTRTDSFCKPFYETHEAEAQRGIQEAMKQEQSKLRNYPGEFDLYLLGTYDESNGIHTSLPQPRLIINLQQLAPKSQPETS